LNRKRLFTCAVLALALTVSAAAFAYGQSGGTAKKFSDTAGHKYESYISKAADYGLFSGFDNGTFKPDATVSRAQFVTVLWRMQGSRESTKEVPFTDISGINATYRKAITWGYENGIINGTTDTTFSPGGAITRQQALAILYRLDGERSGVETMFAGLYKKSISDFSDTSAFAKNAVMWAVYNEIAEAEDGKLQPKAECSRGLLSQYLVKYLDGYKDRVL